MAHFEIVVDGTDSGGKTPTIEVLVPFLGRYYSVEVFAPYKQAEVFPLWATRPQEAAGIITGHMAAFRDDHPSVDVIIWDRGWPTAWVSTEDEAARAMFYPFPTLTVLLLNTIQTTEQKVKKYHLTGEWVTNPAWLQKFSAAYHDLGPDTGARIVRFFPGVGGRYDLLDLCEKIAAEFSVAMREAAS